VTVAANKFEADLARDLAPIYLISGDEPLLMAEAADTVRARARAEGFSEREILTTDRYFDWGELAAVGGAMSLFADRRLIELRIPNGKPGTAGSKALAEFAASPPEDVLLLVTTPRLDKRTMQSGWVKALGKAGRVLQIWPPERGQLPRWVADRMRGVGLEPGPGVAELIADRVEGNLLAADQEVRKLSLLVEPGKVSTEDVARAVADSSRYDVFDLVDALDQGDMPRGHRILAGLHGEGVEPVLVLWAIARELRALATASWETDRGTREGQALRSVGIWPKRQPAARAAMRRHGRSGLLGLVRRAAEVDRVIKGARPGRPWQSLADLVTAIAGGPARGGAA
jgi:DNA polymerase-3 subunit delta